MTTPKQIKIDDDNGSSVTYVRADEVRPSPKLDGLTYVIVRARDSGVSDGYTDLSALRRDQPIALHRARQIWNYTVEADYPDPTGHIREVARDGVKAARVAPAVEVTYVLDACDTTPATEKCRRSIDRAAANHTPTDD